jgi:hypothetical protein
MAENKNIYEGRLALFEHLKGELMMLMGVVPTEFSSKDELQKEMDSIADVAEAIIQALNLEIIEFKDNKLHTVINVGEGA